MKHYLILTIALGLFGASACESDDPDDSNTDTTADAGTAKTSESKTATAGSPAKPMSMNTPGTDKPAETAPTKPVQDMSKPDQPTDTAPPTQQTKPSDNNAPKTPQDIVGTAVAAGSFKQLADALTKANLVDALKGPGPFTVFAPTDAAFEALEKAKPGTLASLSIEQLTAVLKYHVVSGAAVKAAELKNGQLVATLGGPVAAIDLSGDKPKINGVTISQTDIVASNGVIHVIDEVLLPPGDIIEVATAAGKFTKLAAALTSASLVDTLKGEGPFTVFAPTDDAFAKLSAAPTGDALKTVLLYHVLKGTVGTLDLKEGGAATTVAGSPVLFTLKDGAKINDAVISVTNVVAKNGVIHVIDSVIVPPAADIVATAVAAGSFTKLAAALTSADLVPALQAPGPFTVFAPTDAAFEMLASTPSGDALENVLLYHVVEGAVGSGNLVAGAVPSLLKDKSLTIDLSNGVKVNDATVTTANILTKNGIIHVIDKVLVPN
ncbi:MAG TPA: fasciclin domain-containing protein [Polyangiales bacterium]|nr:fasciclin domain-containing protein [Polyangiales bacterium]